MSIVRVLAALLLLGIAWLMWDNRPATTRLKLSAIIKVAGVEYTGEAVQEFTVVRGGDLVSRGIRLTDVTAQALVIRLPDDAAIAFLINDHHGSDNPMVGMVLSCAPWPRDGSGFIGRFREFDGLCELKPDVVPQAVFIPDIATYEGMRVIWETSPVDGDFEMVRFTIKRVDEPLTSDADEALAWIRHGQFPQPYIGLEREDGALEVIRSGHFRRGEWTTCQSSDNATRGEE